MEIKELDVFTLKEMMDSGKDFHLIDVRNPDEFEYCNLNGVLIPMSQIPERIAEIPRDKMVIVQCHHGGRSRKVVQWLQDAHQFDNLYNLFGGIHAWSIEIDSNVPIY
ncbi:MAG: hypothetical protein LW817_07330 [Candidatus Caenarcaniphilales bacterium]|jgi:rhodanese-related sulfurtransferase|nr:hypothetical protein [Candidatus Caenarcaniphilales bacterium]